MAIKAIVYGVTVGDNGEGVVVVQALLQAINDADVAVAETNTSSVTAAFTDSFADIRANLEAQIKISFGDPTMTVIFWDDIGLARRSP